MIVVIFLGLFAMFFALMEGTGQIKYGLKISFSLIFIFLAFRYNFGSDYSGYLKLFQEINHNIGISVFDDYWKTETGWVLLNRISKPIGFFGMTMILALLNCYIYYKFFKKYVPPKYYWISVSLYIFDVSFMMTQLSGYRQTIAILLFIFALDYLYKKDIIRYIICIGIGLFFHLSSILLLPIFILGLVNFKVNKKAFFLLIFSYILLFITIDDVFPQVNLLIQLYLEKYTVYQGDIVKMGRGIGLAITSILFCFIVYFARFQENEKLLVFKIAMLVFLTLPITIAMPAIGRYAMYFQPALLVVYPIILSQIKNPLIRKSLLSVIIILTLYNFKLFFENPLWTKSVMNYQTIFSAPQWF